MAGEGRDSGGRICWWRTHFPATEGATTSSGLSILKQILEGSTSKELRGLEEGSFSFYEQAEQRSRSLVASKIVLIR